MDENDSVNRQQGFPAAQDSSSPTSDFEESFRMQLSRAEKRARFWNVAIVCLLVATGFSVAAYAGSIVLKTQEYQKTEEQRTVLKEEANQERNREIESLRHELEVTREQLRACQDKRK